MRGLRRAERLFHMAVKQVAKVPPESEAHDQWEAYLLWAHEVVGFLRMRHWDWPEEEQEGC